MMCILRCFAWRSIWVLLENVFEHDGQRNLSGGPTDLDAAFVFIAGYITGYRRKWGLEAWDSASF